MSQGKGCIYLPTPRRIAGRARCPVSNGRAQHRIRRAALSGESRTWLQDAERAPSHSPHQAPPRPLAHTGPARADQVASAPPQLKGEWRSGHQPPVRRQPPAAGYSSGTGAICQTCRGPASRLTHGSCRCGASGDRIRRRLACRGP
ncbi:hypothetical protein NDU88_000831 [Pleurodeles waltl]|uniref:Uncharacterized protein n=1 Tax=Pleurodeles waltl TaxID=8319 RepID=A0AAV7SXI9_PLEWA|nr:hypothetical protein NDU88_000831 [Pleurodeles waltl]